MGLNKYQCLTPDVLPFLPRNKILLNDENDDNPETTDTPQSEKDDTSHTSQYYSIAKVKDTKNTYYNDKYKEDNYKLQDSNERVDNPETYDTLRYESVINKTKEEEALIKRLMNMNFKQHLIQSVIDIVTLCGRGDDRIGKIKENKSRKKYIRNTCYYSTNANIRGKLLSTYITSVQNNGTYL